MRTITTIGFRHPVPNIILVDPTRKYHWETSFWDVDFDGTYRLVGLHRDGEWQPYEFKNRCPAKALPDFKCA